MTTQGVDLRVRRVVTIQAWKEARINIQTTQAMTRSLSKIPFKTEEAGLSRILCMKTIYSTQIEM